ncbi:MAG: hypothetical protein K8J08_02505 [Thermoanaerobaculia bacterium]|nr:hypothetical protein [Thermoanaerobaculia bacterium]
MDDRPQGSLTPIAIGLNAVIIAVTDEVPRILVVKRTAHVLAAPESVEPVALGSVPPDALPFGPLDPVQHRTLDRGLRAWVAEQTGLEMGYVEQLYTFGDQHRDPRERKGGPRVISVAYVALVEEEEVAGDGDARWREAYEYLPWEDRREAGPLSILKGIETHLEDWFAAASRSSERAARRERAQIAFGLQGSAWDPDRVLERYELLYEAGLVEESQRELGGELPAEAVPAHPGLGRSMALDHRRILATALGRVRGKIKYRPVVFELLPETFTLLQLQRVVEALSGIRLHKQNFRRLVERGGLVEGTETYDASAGGRPAERFRFRREVLRERSTPGVGLPGAPR